MNTQVAVILFSILYGNIQASPTTEDDKFNMSSTGQEVAHTEVIPVQISQNTSCSSTDQGSASSESHCGKEKAIDGLLISVNEPYTFLEASKTCEEKGLTLAYIKNDVENEELTRQISLLDIPQQGFWLGGVYMHLKEKFFWYPSDELMIYNKWIDDKIPPNGPVCSMFNYTKGDQSSPWLKKDCQIRLPYVCRNSSQENGTTSRHIANPEMEGFNRFNDPNVQFRTGFLQDWRSKLRRLAHGFFYGWF